MNNFEFHVQPKVINHCTVCTVKQRLPNFVFADHFDFEKNNICQIVFLFY